MTVFMIFFHSQNLLNIGKINMVISFLPVLFNQLFHVLSKNNDDEVITVTTRYSHIKCLLCRICQRFVCPQLSFYSFSKYLLPHTDCPSCLMYRYISLTLI